MIYNNRNNVAEANSASTSSPFQEWDQPFTDQELQAIDAIEAAFLSTSSAAPSSPSNNCHSAPQTDQNLQNSRRRKLPSSIAALCKPFSLSPCQGNMKMRLPAMKFGGHIVYSRTKMEVEKAASQLLQSLREIKGAVGEISLGFDIEWKPSFRRGVIPGKAAVMQLCADYKLCHVMHIIHSGITPSLQLLLEDSTIVKVGVGIGGDRGKVFKDYNISVKPVEDLSSLAKQKLGGELRTWSLKSLTERLVCKEIGARRAMYLFKETFVTRTIKGNANTKFKVELVRKPNRIRLGNWEVSILSEKQLEYAATDAFASWHLYEVLKSLPEPEQSEKVDEQQLALQ